MTHQRTDREVARDAARFNTTKHELESFLRKNGIRNVHTSPKARTLIERAARSRPVYVVNRTTGEARAK